MPGIVGLIKRDKHPDNLTDLSKMVASLMHENFYNSSQFIHEELGFYGGSVNIKGSFCDCMPVISNEKDLICIFSGENIKDRDYVSKYLNLRDNQIESLGAKYLINLYKNKKLDFFNELNGFFQGVLVDIQRKTIELFLDRYGMRRLYYYQDNSEFIFSSEAKAILKIRPNLKLIDLESLGEFFRCGCVMNDNTLFRNIKLVPGGSLWTFKPDGSIDKKKYFVPNTFENQSRLESIEFFNKIKEVFLDILPKYFLSDRQVGLSLTGGLDTRMILAATDMQPGTIPCFTYGGMYRDSYDVEVSKKVAEAAGQMHHVVRVDGKFLKNFREYAEKSIYLSDGCVDVTAAPNLYVSEKARDIADIRLTGNYGQEVFRRYIAFKPNSIDENLFDREFVKYLKQSAEVYENTISNYNPLTFALFKQAPWFQYGRYSVENSQMIQRSPFMDNDLVKLVYQAPDNFFYGDELSSRIIYDLNNTYGNITTDLGKLGKLPLGISLIFKTWRYFLFKMEWYYNNNPPRFAESIDNLLGFLNTEKYFLGRNKYYHMRKWYREDLSEYIGDTLMSSRFEQRDIINSKYIKKIIEDHIKNKRSSTDKITTILSYEIISQLFYD